MDALDWFFLAFLGVVVIFLTALWIKTTPPRTISYTCPEEGCHFKLPETSVKRNGFVYGLAINQHINYHVTGSYERPER